MHRSLLEVFACPSCRVEVELVAHLEQGEDVMLGFLRCRRCAVVVPILDGLVMFSEPLLAEQQASASALRALALRLFGTTQGFFDYRRHKQQRGVIEAYAAFAPFNESVRAVETVLPHAIGSLQPGEFILDTWCRTGFGGEWLAGRFAEQRVVALWEGNSSVLGYRGFRHLLGPGRRAANLDIVFTHPQRPLPFRDDAFGLLYSYDSLHRHGLIPFAGECLRVTRDDGALLFGHLHLSNSEPEPFFERGCDQFHGRDYRAWLDRVTATGSRRGWVLDEARLFEGPGEATLVDEPDTAHYNGMVAILPASPADAVHRGLPQWGPSRRFVASPLFRLNLGRGRARVAMNLFDGAVGHLLARHPVYQARLPDGTLTLDEPTQLAFLLASIGWTEHAITRVQVSGSGAMVPALERLVEHELLRPVPVSAAAHELQRFHANQLPARDCGVLGGFWSRIENSEHELLTLAEGDGLCGRELDELRRRVAAVLVAQGLVAGDWLAVSVAAHPLLLLASVAAASSGFHVRVMAGAESPDASVALGRAALWLRGDGEPDVAGHAALGLGLTGQGPSLLALLDSIATPDAVVPVDDGIFELPLQGGVARCRLADLVDACESLEQQLESSFGSLDGRSPFADLIVCLLGWSRLERVRTVAYGGLG